MVIELKQYAFQSDRIEYLWYDDSVPVAAYCEAPNLCIKFYSGEFITLFYDNLEEMHKDRALIISCMAKILNGAQRNDSKT